MELTRKDRVVLINQYRILKRLDPDSASHYDELIEILERGYAMFYGRIATGLQESEIPEDVVGFVENIFALYRAIENYKSANPGDQDVANHPWASFRGFDSATETDCLLFARFLGNGLDSKAPTLSKYRTMVAIYQALGGSGELCPAGIRQVLGLIDAEAPATAEAEPEMVEDETGETTAETENAADTAETEAAPKPARKRSTRSKT